MPVRRSVEVSLSEVSIAPSETQVAGAFAASHKVRVASNGPSEVGEDNWPMVGRVVFGSRGADYGLLSLPDSSTAMKAFCGISTEPIDFIRFFPSFCLAQSFFFREISPP
jgi:hypothetical protein